MNWTEWTETASFLSFVQSVQRNGTDISVRFGPVTLGVQRIIQGLGLTTGWMIGDDHVVVLDKRGGGGGLLYGLTTSTGLML